MRYRSVSRHADLFRERLDSIIDMRHPLVRLATAIDWQGFDDAFGKLYSPVGRPGVAARLMVGLHYLKHAYDLSDEVVVELWLENPYWQHFCGQDYFSHELPIDPSSMTRWPTADWSGGDGGAVEGDCCGALDTGTIQPSSLERVTVDTTVQPKAIAHPNDS